MGLVQPVLFTKAERVTASIREQALIKSSTALWRALFGTCPFEGMGLAVGYSTITWTRGGRLERPCNCELRYSNPHHSDCFQPIGLSSTRPSLYLSYFPQTRRQGVSSLDTSIFGSVVFCVQFKQRFPGT